MSKKMKHYNKGDCVEVSTWDHDSDDFFTPIMAVGLVLEYELIDMGPSDDEDRAGRTEEWMYRIVTTDGSIVEAWDYEIKLVNRAA